MEILTPFSIRDSSKLAMLPALSIVLLARDIPRCTILRVVNPGPFAFRQDTISLGVILHPVDVFLLLVQSIRFPFIQLSADNTLIDPLLLTGLALVDHRRLSLSIYGPA